MSYQWYRNGLQIAAGSTPTVRLPDGDNILTLVVFDDDGNTASDIVQVGVAAPPFVAILSALPGLTPNQLSLAIAMDTLCPRLRGREASLSGDQLDLLRRCDAITFGSTASEQVRALDEISPQDLNATRSQTLNLSRTQLSNVADRLIALRQGAKGLSLVGLNLSTEDAFIPASQVASSFDRVFLGGGASADEPRENLFDDRLGLWVRGNYSFGEKRDSQADHGFDADQWGFMGGADFRFTPLSVLALPWATANRKWTSTRSAQARLDTTATTAAAVRNDVHEERFLRDAIAKLLRSDYDSCGIWNSLRAVSPLDLSAADARAEQRRLRIHIRLRLQLARIHGRAECRLQLSVVNDR